MKLLELFDNPVKWEMVDKYTAEYEIGDTLYELKFYPPKNDGVYWLSFAIVDEDDEYQSGITGGGNEIVVHSTLVAFAHYMSKKYEADMDYAVFTGAEASRVRLYDRLVFKMFPKNEWDLTKSKNQKGETVYTSKRKRL